MKKPIETHCRMAPVTGLILLLTLSGIPAERAAAEETVSFKMHRVGQYRSEALGVGDFNSDDLLDIVAGPYVYLAPNWKPVEIRHLEGEVDNEGRGYMHDFANLPLDVDQDGRLDVVSVMWHEKQAVWYRNIGLDGKLWPESVIESGDNFESADLADLDGDGQCDEVLPHTGRTSWYSLAEKKGDPLVVNVAAGQKMMFGAGAGDVNADGRIDILRPDAWLEAPPKDPAGGEWKIHPWSIGGEKADKPDHTPQILVHDVNRDGLPDVITSVAHKYGIFWYEQTRGADGRTGWKRHTIDNSWSQAHSLTLADLDGDGDLDLVTGKRYFAHNGKDPGANEPAGVHWYEYQAGDTPKWVHHAISLGDGVGSALNIPVVDLDGDGDLDIVVTGKWGGPAWFENLRISRAP